MRAFIATTRRTSGSSAVFLIRFAVGLTFLVEGILKFMLPDELGIGDSRSFDATPAEWSEPAAGP